MKHVLGYTLNFSLRKFSQHPYFFEYIFASTIVLFHHLTHIQGVTLHGDWNHLTFAFDFSGGGNLIRYTLKILKSLKNLLDLAVTCK